MKHSPIDNAAFQRFKPDDEIILIAEKWRDYEIAINTVLDAAENGSALIIGYLPGNDVLFRSKMSDFGIADIGAYRLCNNLVV